MTGRGTGKHIQVRAVVFEIVENRNEFERNRLQSIPAAWSFWFSNDPDGGLNL